MTTPRDLADALTHLEPVDERESASIAATRERLTWPGDPYDEDQNAHHLTASAFIVSARGVILHRHRALGIWVQPGGHVDAGEGPAAAALRETKEETGLDAVHVDESRPYQVDVHPGPRGHTHYDVRYVLLASPEEPTPAPGEASEVFWFDFASAIERCEPSLVPVLRRLAREHAGSDVRD
ncbi:MAG: NUDIX hydrolase [Acidimicrobiales bacterium]